MLVTVVGMMVGVEPRVFSLLKATRTIPPVVAMDFKDITDEFRAISVTVRTIDGF
jgi:hypothetical protein